MHLPGRRRRILVAVEPAVLEGALALLLEAGAGNEVVQFHDGVDVDPAARYDAAIVTVELLTDVHAEVVITLPGAGSGPGIGHVTTGDDDREVLVHSHQQVIDLLDEQFPRECKPPGSLVIGG